MKPLDLVLHAANSGGSQVFLGAPWVPLSIKMAPASWRERIALEWLAISPHYCFRTGANRSMRHVDFLKSEWERNTRSRQLIADHIVRPHLKSDFTVLDYGCGPGFLSAVCSNYVRRVVACDISSGVLECAKVLNGRPNIEYLFVPPTGRLHIEDRSVDLVYSFAVVQHIEDRVFQKILKEFLRVMKVGSRPVCHVVLSDAADWQTEADWRDDRSLAGRAKWFIGLHCFGREPGGIRAAVESTGFSDISIDAVHVPTLEDAIANQHLLRFRKLH